MMRLTPPAFPRVREAAVAQDFPVPVAHRDDSSVCEHGIDGTSLADKTKYFCRFALGNLPQGRRVDGDDFTAKMVVRVVAVAQQAVQDDAAQSPLLDTERRMGAQCDRDGPAV